MQDGELEIGLMGIKRHYRPKMAEDAMNKKTKPPTSKAGSSFKRGETPYDDIFECERRFGHMKKNPEKHGIKTKIINIQDLEADAPGTYVFFGKLKEKNLRDMNETVNLAKERWSQSRYT